MQARITYLLTEQAQRAQMAATGQPVAREHTTVEDIPVTWLESKHLVRVDANGAITVDLTESIGLTERGEISGNWGYAAISPAFDTMPSSGLAALDMRAEQIATKQAELRASAERRAAEVREREKQEAVRRAEEAAREKVRNEEAAAVERVKQDYIARWVEEHGDDTLRAQFADGLACRRTIVSMIAEAAFAGRGIPEEHQATGVCQRRECLCSDAAADCLPAETYAVWRGIKPKLPEGGTVEFRAVRDCLIDEDDGTWPGQDDGAESAGPRYYVADVKMPHGPFVFERRIKL